MSIYKGTTPITPTKNIEMSDADLQLLTDEVDRLLGVYPAPVPQGPIAYATAQSGIEYTSLADLTEIYTSGKLGSYADAIAVNTEISNTQETVYIHDGDNHYSISVGATYSYELSTGEAMTDRILGFRHDTLSSDHTSKAGITLQMKDCLNTMYSMNDSNTNAGGWGASLFRTTILPTQKLLLPSDLQNLIKFVDKKAANGGSTNYTATETYSDDLFLLCEKEIFGSVTRAQDGANEGIQYEYWVGKSASDRIKNVYGYASRWWERSSHNSSTSGVCLVYSNGDADYTGASFSRGISFAYCLGGVNE